MNDMAVLELLQRIAASREIGETWEIATGYFAALGFQRCNYGFTRFRHMQSIGDPDDALYLTTCDPEYVDQYFRGGFFSRTPLYRWSTRNSGHCTWRWVQEAYEQGRLSADEADTVRQNQSMGIRAGLTFSFPDASSRAKGALGMIANRDLDFDDVDRIWSAHGAQISAVANMMHLRLVQLPNLAQGRTLSPRQREALEWVADGKTTQDVALLMGVSPAMVEKHLRLAREALSVETTAQAVAKGTLLNLIFQHSPELQAQAAS